MGNPYEDMGGRATVAKIVTKFYKKTIADPELRPFFANVLAQPTGLMALEEKQTEYLGALFGGPGSVEEYDLQRVHAPLQEMGLCEKHFGMIVRHIKESMQELDVDVSCQRRAIERIMAVRPQILGT